MANTEKVSEQLTRIKDGFDKSNHTFLTRLMSGLQKRIADTVPELEVTPTGKQATVGHIRVNMIGSKVVEDETVLADNQRKIRQLMDIMKNPTAIIGIIGE